MGMVVALDRVHVNFAYKPRARLDDRLACVPGSRPVPSATRRLPDAAPDEENFS